MAYNRAKEKYFRKYGKNVKLNRSILKEYKTIFYERILS